MPRCYGQIKGRRYPCDQPDAVDHKPAPKPLMVIPPKSSEKKSHHTKPTKKAESPYGRMKRQILSNPNDKRHGTRRAALVGCECNKCIHAREEYLASVRERYRRRKGDL